MVLRIDKWLYFTRFYKTRGLAAKAVRGGHVKINGSRAKPSSSVTPGDVLEITRDQLPWRIEAIAIPPRRGPAAEARQCYVENEEVAARRQDLLAGRRMDRLQMPRTDGRPDKRTRRKLRERRRG
jgi:ribosome-associated heat shock protein Hsp15